MRLGVLLFKHNRTKTYLVPSRRFTMHIYILYTYSILYINIFSQCIYIYTHTYKLLEVYLTHLKFDAPLQSRLQLYSTTMYNSCTDIAYCCIHHTSFRVPPNGSERFRSTDFSRTISNYIEPFVFCAQHTTERFRTVQR